MEFLKLEGLKPEQEQRIKASVLSQPDDLVILPTGFGKVPYTKFCKQISILYGKKAESQERIVLCYLL